MWPFEQGPIRPPSEAQSLLVRVSRNCPWNRCAFCSVYRGQSFSLRPVDEVVADLDAMLGYYGPNVRTVFLQDANALLTPPDQLEAVLLAIKARFPRVDRITTYARSHTLAHRNLEDLVRLREAGLNRVHIGFESGSDEVLAMINKGTTRAQQIVGGQRARTAGFEVSEYWMPGLGGVALSGIHAADSASALRDIGPHFIRLRTTAVIRGTPLALLRDEGRFVELDEVGKVREIRAFLAALGDLECRIESDHVLNLLMELRGDLPQELPALLAVCDGFLSRSGKEQYAMIQARRRGGVWL
jgi:radical SAM superfamily enzyme